MRQAARILAHTLLAGLIAGPVLASPAPDFGDIAMNLGRQISSVTTALTMAVFVAGVVMAMIGLMKIRRGAETPNDPASRPHVGIVFLLVGSAMVALPAMIGTGVVTIFGANAPITDGSGGFSFLP